MCGEQVNAQMVNRSSPGSSPRVRGTVFVMSDPRLVKRFIPACAGNSRPSWARRVSSTVHPRVCGEQHLPNSQTSATNGSSPRVRGTENNDVFTNSVHRFIPACAGNSVRAQRNTSFQTVHPRVCGEQESCYHSRLRYSGSSPRVRGTVCEVTNTLALVRFIPACAGNSQS